MKKIFLTAAGILSLFSTFAAPDAVPEKFNSAQYSSEEKCWNLRPIRSVLKGILHNVDADRYKAVAFQIESPDGYVGELQFVGSDNKMHSEFFLIRHRDGRRDYVINLTNHAWWKGELKSVDLRISAYDYHAGDLRPPIKFFDARLQERPDYLFDKKAGTTELDILIPGHSYRLTAGKLHSVEAIDMDGNASDVKIFGDNEFTLPAHAMHTRLKLTPTPDANLIETKQVRMLPPGSAIGMWKAPWIWYPEKTQDNSQRYFRMEISVPEKFQSAWAFVTADDSFTISANGQPVGKGANWAVPQLVNLTSHLRSGENNTLEFDVWNGMGGAGLRAEIVIVKADGTRELIPSGPNWQVAKAANDSFVASAIVNGPITPYCDLAAVDLSKLSAGSFVKPPAKANLPKGFPVAKLAWRNNLPEFIVDDKVYAPYIYHFSGGFFHSAAPEMGIVDELVKSNLHIYQISDEYYLNKVWPSENKFDFAPFDDCIRRLLERDPEAKIILNPSINMPVWWQKKYPDELIGIADPAKGRKTALPSPASQQWRQDASKYLEALLKHIETSDYGRALIGVLPAALQTIEWVYWPHHVSSMADMSDYSPAAEAAFRRYLREKYSGDSARLKKLYADPNVEFDTVKVPPPELLAASENGYYRDPARAQYAIDYWESRNQECADAMLHFCKVVKDVSNGKLLAGSYFGYFLEHIPHDNLVRSGHIMLDKVLKSPDVDILCAPVDYLFRIGNAPALTMSPADSLRHHGKLWIQEVDVRGYLSAKSYLGSDNQYVHGKTDAPSDMIEIMRKNHALVRAQGYGFWWYDLNGGWFNNPYITGNLLSRWKKADETYAYSGELLKMPVEVAYVFDGYHAPYTAMRGGPGLALRSLMKNFNRIPAPRDIIQLTDFADCKLPKYKIYFFVNCYWASPELREKIQEKLAEDGATAVWLTTGGYFDGTPGVSPSLENVRKLTGFGTNQVTTPTSVVTTLDGNGTQKIQWRFPSRLNPVFVVDDASAKVLSKDGANVVAAEKAMGKWKSIFFSGIYLPADALDKLCREAGVRYYTDSIGHYYYIGNGFAAVNFVKSGKQLLRFPEAVDVIDYETGKLLKSNVREYEVDGNIGENKMFLLHNLPK